MKRKHKNAFTSHNSGELRGPRSSLAGMLSPLRASLEKTGFGCRLTLSPIRLPQAMAVWSELAPDSEMHTLIFTVHPSNGRANGGSLSIADTAAWLGVEGVESFDDGSCVFEGRSLHELLGLLQPAGMMAVLVDGQIEARDAKAMIRSVRAGGSPLEAEIRAVAAIRAKSDRSVVLDARTTLQAAMLVAENFRHYLAAMRDQPVAEFTRPEPWQVERALQVTGALTVRPIETEVFSTSIDIGISTDPDGRPKPADQSLIYDIFSRTWHDEP